MNSLLFDYMHGRIPRNVPTRGTVNGAMNVNLPPTRQEVHVDSDEESDDLEAQEYVNKEMKYYFQEQKQSTGGLTDIDDGCEESVIGSEYFSEWAIPEVYTKYRFDVYCKLPLPIDDFRNRILDIINSNQVVVIQGHTGCGKTTQVPQYILDQCREKNIPCNIVVTQPRRIAAINIANRVCEERGWAMETVCGYQVGLEKRVSESVILTYVTTEVLLQKLIQQKNLNKYTHVIIDEVHERNKSLDFLMLIVRKYLFTNSRSVRVILMSATMEASQFAYYFRQIPRVPRSDYLPAPILDVDKMSEFTTNIYFLEQIITREKIPAFSNEDPSIDPSLYELVTHLLKVFDEVDKVDPVTNEHIIGSVLIFLPGFHEIDEMNKYLQNPLSLKLRWDVIQLHSSLSNESMHLAFQKPKKGSRKIILSTNIAESSVTVPDVTYVIDFCLTKVMTVNATSKFSTLRLEWASHNNCKQRAGRVGRVADGRVYRLVPKEFYKNKMKQNTVPEMQRAPLENIILYMKLLDLNDTPKNILSLALSPPNLKEVESCIWHLKEIGALLRTCRDEMSSADGDITFLGRIMGHLPIDVHLAKLIILGHMFSCLRETIIMAAGATARNIFTQTFYDRIECYKKKLDLADHSDSDFIAMLNLYDVWIKFKREKAFKTEREEENWCKSYYINYKGLKEMGVLIAEIEMRLKKYKIQAATGAHRVNLTDLERPTVLKTVICGAFYPNYFLKSAEFGTVDVREAVKELNGRDPCCTVYFGNMVPNQPGQIYVRQIKKIMGAKNNVHISFDGDSSKIFVEYRNARQPERVTIDGREMLAKVPGRIANEVYLAVRKRQLKHNFSLKVLPVDMAMEFAEKIETYNRQISQEETNCFSNIDYSPLPSLDIEYITVVVSHIVDVGHFYCQNSNQETLNLLNEIDWHLNSEDATLRPIKGSIDVDGKLYAAKFNEDNKYYRCRVDHINPRSPQNCQIIFVDYGNVQLTPVMALCELPEERVLQIQPIAMCCMLSEVQPCPSANLSAIWSEKVNNIFKSRTKSVELTAKVYSMVDDIVHLELYLRNPKKLSNPESFNQWLIQNGFGQHGEESYRSKADHDLRRSVLLSDNPNSSAAQINAKKLNAYKDYLPPPDMDDNAFEIKLTGPFSPLETKVCGLVRASMDTNVRIDESSVNTVLLDDNPEAPHGRLLVAGQVGQSSSNRTLKLNQTTMMPNVPGFPMLMTLLFCPTMEPKITCDGTRVGGILCGLGHIKGTSTPLFPTHDIPLVLDTELKSEDIEEINNLRYCMNRALKYMNNIFDEMATPDELYSTQRMLKDSLFKMLRTPRQIVEPSNIKYIETWNKFLHDAEVLKMKSEVAEPDDIFSMLWFARLSENKLSEKLIEKNLDDLLNIAKRLVPAKQIICELCKSEPLLDEHNVRIHLICDDHKKKFAEFKLQCNNSK